jgi:hypothetical protein
MATYSAIQYYNPPLLLPAGTARTRTMPLDESLWLDFLGDYTTNRPSGSQSTLQQNTLRACCMNDQYSAFLYGRVWVIPETIDLGKMTKQYSQTVEVWNATENSIDLNSISESGTSGMTLIGPASPPTAFMAKESRIYDFDVSMVGQSIIDAEYSFNFATQTPTLAITGSRVVPWAFLPNWGRAVIERLAWKTGVQERLDGSEQRRRYRTIHRRGFDFTFTVNGRGKRRLESQLRSWQKRLYALPIFVSPGQLNAAITNGDGVIQIDTAGLGFVDGGLGVVMDENGKAEPFDIVTVTTSSIAINGTFLSDWPIRSRIYPVRLARLSGSVQISRFDGDTAEGLAQFELEEYDDITAVDGAITYRGKSILVDKPNWVNDITAEYLRRVNVLDAGTGLTYTDDITNKNYTIQAHNFITKTKQEIDDFKAWLSARGGRLTSFWMPTWSRDLIPVFQISAAAVELQVKNAGYTQYLLDRIDSRDILIRDTGGNVYARRIIDAVETSDDLETLSMDSPIGVTLQPEDIEAISFIRPARLDTDIVELSWWTDESVDSTINMRGINDDI